MDTIARIRREFFRHGKSIKEIVRDLHVSRNTVRKVLRSGATAFEYSHSEQPRPKLGRWRGELDGMLLANGRGRSASTTDAYVPLSFAPGEASQSTGVTRWC